MRRAHIFGPKAGEIAVAEIVCENEHNVRPFRRHELAGGQGEEQEGREAHRGEERRRPFIRSRDEAGRDEFMGTTERVHRAGRSCP